MKKLLTIAVLVIGCGTKVSEEKLISEAIVLHNSMLKKSTLIENRLNELKADSTVHQDSIALLVRLLEQWESDLIEVPGNDEHNHDHHSHNHEHTTLDVTPEQMLEIQKELDARLSRIGNRTTRLKPQNDNEHDH